MNYAVMVVNKIVNRYKNYSQWGTLDKNRDIHDGGRETILYQGPKTGKPNSRAPTDGY